MNNKCTISLISLKHIGFNYVMTTVLKVKNNYTEAS